MKVSVVRSTVVSFLFFMAAIVAMVLPAQAKGNPRYAALIVDADSGQVLHASNANATRYPASLTKVMTLYLTFEALRAGKLTLDSELPVSKKAASMPQTNLSLRAGQTIKVRDAIQALVVRSANDVAVVVAEALGKTEWGFGLKMTSKARELGMHSTVFRNASGLPDSKQYTTARDLSVLAIAVKKHFPEYFHFFKTRSFTYKGRTYHSHNHAMKLIPGADGLKTGFINASGFNLITTVERQGRRLVGVVMGGRTGYTRDAHMRDLMEQTYAKLMESSPTQQFAQAVPVPKPRPVLMAQTPAASAAAPVIAPVAQSPVESMTVANSAPAAHYAMESTPTASVTKPMRLTAPVPAAKPANLATASTRLQGQFQPVAYRFPSANTRNWGVQVGAYRHSEEALIAAQRAAQLASNETAGAQIIVSDGIEGAGQVIHRARLANMQEEQARQTCQRLIMHNTSCFVFRNRDQADSL